MLGPLFSPDPEEQIATIRGACQLLGDAWWSILAARPDAWSGAAADGAEERRQELVTRVRAALDQMEQLESLLVVWADLVQEARHACLAGAS